MNYGLEGVDGAGRAGQWPEKSACQNEVRGRIFKFDAPSFRLLPQPVAPRVHILLTMIP